MAKEVWLKEELASRGHHGTFDMPVRKFIDWCRKQLKEIPASCRNGALLNIDITDFETGDIEISVSYTPSDAVTPDTERE